MRRVQFYVFWLIVMLAHGSIQAATIYVGTGAACQFADIQSAVNSAAANGQAVNTIRIARNRTYTAQHIIIQNQVILVLAGGFADCSQTVADTTQTNISGAGGAADSVIEILGTGDVTLSGLRISDGDTPSNANGGGIAISGGPHVVSVYDSLIQSNTAGSGGGISVSSSNATTQAIRLDLYDNVLIAGNASTTTSSGSTTSGGGGGIFCNNATVNMVVQAGRINSNTAAASGGGVRAVNCSMRLASADLLGLFLLNSANVSGGALSVSGANSDVNIFTVKATSPTILRGNHADNQGGAIEVFSSAKVTAWNLNFIDNSASVGGAVSVFDSDAAPDASFEFDPLRSPPVGSVRCGAGVPCKEFRANLSTTPLGAISTAASTFFVSSGGSSTPLLAVNEASIRDSKGGHIALASNQSALRFHTCAFFNNQLSDTLIKSISATASVSLTDSSIGGNLISGLASAAISGQGAVALLRVAALTPGRPLVNSSGTVTASWVIANDLTGTTPTTNNLQTDPLFNDAANGNLRLRSDSPALDYAPLSAFNVLSIDLDDVLRPIDITSVPDEFGPRDAGAYESLGDVILQNGFE
jgi:hypothetical protein